MSFKNKLICFYAFNPENQHSSWNKEAFSSNENNYSGQTNNRADALKLKIYKRINNNYLWTVASELKACISIIFFCILQHHLVFFTIEYITLSDRNRSAGYPKMLQ